MVNEIDSEYNLHLKSEWNFALQHVSLYKQPQGFSAT